MFYKFITNLTPEECDKLVEGLSPIESQLLGEIVAWDQVIDGSVVSYVIADRSTLAKIVLFFKRNCLDFRYVEISDDVLSGKIKFEDPEFSNEINNFIQKYLTVDHVLDKINQFGIDSLTELDKECLQSN